MVDVVQLAGRALPADQVCHIMYQTCKAVQHMHSQEPPILHRDLKVVTGQECSVPSQGLMYALAPVEL